MSAKDSVSGDLTQSRNGVLPNAPTLVADSLPRAGGEAASTWEPRSSLAGDSFSAPPPLGFQPADNRLHTTLVGKYRLERLLGEGGCGRVYLATHQQLRTHVAIKFLLSHWASRPIFRERFRREARALALLSHPGIVGVHDFGDDAGDMYLVMEYVRGEPLANLVLKDGQPMPPERAAEIIDQILEVLAIAHERGIVHRELLL